MMLIRMTWRVTAAMLACVVAGPAGPAPAADAPGGEARPPATQPAGKAKPVDLERLALSRPPVPATRSRNAVAAARRGAALPADGTALNALACRLSAPDARGWRTVQFEPAAGEAPVGPRRVLPCRLLEQMENVAQARAKTVFRIWGENTVYRDRLYILPLAVTVVRPSVPAIGPPPTKTPASRPAAGGEGVKPGPAGIDDVVGELLKDKPERAVVIPTVPADVKGAPDKAVAPGAKPAVGADRGEIVVDRLVRILPQPDGPWTAARFESDNTLAEPPMRLLPCATLSRAQELAEDGMLFRVTGRTTYYRTRRYLLLRKVLRQRRLGRF